MPKSILTLQSQISNCEKAMKETMEICATTVNDRDFKFFINIQEFMNNVTTYDLDKVKAKCENLLEVVNQTSKVLELETKRRKYKAELHKKIAVRQLKEGAKKRQMERSLRRVNEFQSLSLPPNSQELENNTQ